MTTPTTPNTLSADRSNTVTKAQVVGAALALALATAYVVSDWFLLDRMPGGDFPGYVASLDQVQHWLAELGRVPRWCPQCYGGSSVFTSRFKEVLASPLVWVSEPVVATKMAFAACRWLAALGIFACFVRFFSAPYVGVAAGLVYSFGSYSNHEIEHLEVAFAAMLLPAFLLAAAETIRGNGRAAPIVLGVLAAATFSNSWIQAIVSLVLAGLLLWLRPWDGFLVTPRSIARRLALAVLVAMLLSASSLAWMTSDAPNHRLINPTAAAKQREVWSLRSPVVLFNREGVLADWLVDHLRVGPRIASYGSGSHYLGVGAIALAVGGWFLARRQRRERRWYQLAALILLLQFNLASGPYVVLEQLGWNAAGVASVQLAILLVALGFGATLILLSRRRQEALSTTIEGAVALLILVVLISVPLYQGLALLLPPLRVHHSPGHFAALLSFPLAILFGLGLRALSRIPRVRIVQAGVGVGLCVLVYIDYAPSIRSFSEGRPLAPLREAAHALESLEHEDLTVRIAQTRTYSPTLSYLTENAGLGFAWGWLPWQAGSPWSDYVENAVWNRDRLEPARQQILLGMGRIRYFLLAPGSDRYSPNVLPAPWTLRLRSGEFEIWEQPEIRPFASFYPDLPSGRRTNWVRDIGTTLRLDWTRPAPERIDVRLPAEHPSGWILLSESHHPWWGASVDGDDVELIRAGPAFIGIPVGTDTRVVSVTFEPPLLLTIADQLTTWAGVFVLFLGVVCVYQHHKPDRSLAG